MSTPSQPRTPAGNGRASGRFAEKQHSEPNVALMGPGTAPAKEGDGLSGHDRGMTDGRMIESRRYALTAKRALADQAAKSLARTILARHPDAKYLELVNSGEEYAKLQVGDILDADHKPISGPVTSPAWRDGNSVAGTTPEQLVGELDSADPDAGWRKYTETPSEDGSVVELNLKSAAGYGPHRGWRQDLTSVGRPSEVDLLHAQQMQLDAQVRELKNRNDMLVVAELSQRIRAADQRIAYIDVTVDEEDQGRLWATRMCDADGDPYDAADGGQGEPGMWEVEGDGRPFVSGMVRDLQVDGHFGTWGKYATEVSDGSDGKPLTWRIDLHAASTAHRQAL